MPVKFITQKILDAVPKLYEQEKLGDAAIVHAKWFDAWGSWSWYMTELDPVTQRAFGLVIGFETEIGYFDLNELQELKIHGIPRIERDLWFKQCTIGEVRSTVASR